MSVVLPAIETDGSAGDSEDDFIRSLCRAQPSQHSLSQNSGHGVGGMSVQPAGAEDCQESSDEEWARTLCRGAGLAADGASRGHLDHIVGSRHPPAAQLEGPSPVARLGGPGTEVEHSHSSRERGPARGNITSGPSGAAVSRRGVVACRRGAAGRRGLRPRLAHTPTRKTRLSALGAIWCTSLRANVRWLPFTGTSVL